MPAAAAFAAVSVSAPTPATPATTPTTPTVPTLVKKPLPAGRPREWYESHNRRLKAMRLAIALLDTGVYTPGQARNRRIRSTAVRLGVHRPSNTTCRLVRSLIHDPDQA